MQCGSLGAESEIAKCVLGSIASNGAGGKVNVRGGG